AFSPDGRQVAYIRMVNGYSGGFPIFGIPSIRVINIDGTGDRELLRFTQGSYVSRVSWSPDGSRLVFDLGRQTSISGYPVPLIDATTSGLYLMNADGSGVVQIQTPPAVFPSWNPAGI